MIRNWLLAALAGLMAMAAQGVHAADAAGERRVALVIGNNDYQHVTKLENAVADAKAFRRELESRGFQVVYRENANRRAMNDAVEEFIGKLSTDAVSVIYYSGHGIQINSANYLIPTDLQASKEADVAYDSVDLARVVDRVSQAQAKFTLAVVDACRNNPFAGTGRSIGGRGLAAPSGNASGVMIVYSAGANQQALDRLGGDDRDPNGLFTREFLKAMRVPGLNVQDAVSQVKLAVIERAKSVGHVQTPAIYDQSVGTFMFTPGVAAPAPQEDPQKVRQEIADAKAELERLRLEQEKMRAAGEQGRQQVAVAPQPAPVQPAPKVTPAVTQPVAPPPAPSRDTSWRNTLSRFDQGRLDGYMASWDRAWAEASKEPAKPEIALARSLATDPVQAVADGEIAGSYQCRVVKVGGMLTVAYGWQPCRIGTQGSDLMFEKTGGSQRMGGRLFRASDSAFIYAGTWWAASDPVARYNQGEPSAMNCNDYRNEVGVFFKLGPKHFVIGMPQPLCESSFDLIEISSSRR